ncbi:hypothetical protein N510_003425 [Firmicutes bacterium ASF500]|nr:hypothetical protein N510_003425 [Firmicutes bacterium ASF500]
MNKFLIPFQIGVAKSRFAKPRVKISKVSNPLTEKPDVGPETPDAAGEPEAQSVVSAVNNEGNGNDNGNSAGNNGQGNGNAAGSGDHIRLYYHMDYLGTADYLTSPVSGKAEAWPHYNEWGLNTKIHLAVDANGMPVRILVTEGTRADCKEAVHLIEGISTETLLADRGYDTNDILAYVVSAGMEPVIPPKKNRKEQRGYDKYLPYCVPPIFRLCRKMRLDLRRIINQY